MSFLRDVFERRKQSRGKEDLPKSSALVKSVDELDRFSAALNEAIVGADVHQFMNDASRFLQTLDVGICSII
jgi:hypothetical protein